MQFSYCPPIAATINDPLVGLHCVTGASSSHSSSSAASSSASSACSGRSNSDAASISSERTNPSTARSAASASATNASGSSSRSGSSRRIRTVRLQRPNSSASARRSVLISTAQSTAFGFAIRGGREFSIGFFVSRIEKGSEADARGLMVITRFIAAARGGEATREASSLMRTLVLFLFYQTGWRPAYPCQWLCCG